MDPVPRLPPTFESQIGNLDRHFDFKDEDGIPICPAEECKNRAVIGCSIVFPHTCGDRSCKTRPDSYDEIVFPVIFCDQHVPGLDNLIGTSFFNLVIEKIKKSGAKAPTNLMLLTAHIYEENRSLS